MCFLLRQSKKVIIGLIPKTIFLLSYLLLFSSEDLYKIRGKKYLRKSSEKLE